MASRALSQESHYERISKDTEPSRDRFAMDNQAEAAAAMERADRIVKDVRSTKQQMKNIVMNMHEVRQQIRSLRQQLQLVDTDDAPSTAQDEQHIQKLRADLAGYRKELLSMKEELIQEQMEDLIAHGTSGDLRSLAEDMIETMIADVMQDVN